MKYLKRFVIVLVVLLAVVGVFSLLKKPPKIEVPDEDFAYLEEMFGTSMKSGAESEGRLSSILGNTIEGVPSLHDDLSGLSAAPPSSLGASAPAYGEAPSFVAGSEASAFGASPEAPAYLPPVPAAIESSPAPLYGDPFDVIPIVAPVEPSRSATIPPSTQTLPIPDAPIPDAPIPDAPIPDAPAQTAPSPPEPESAPPWPVPVVMPDPPVPAAPPFQDAATSANTMPSSVLEPWGASGVTEHNNWNGPATPRELAVQAPVPVPDSVPRNPPAFDPSLLTPTGSAPLLAESSLAESDRFSDKILLDTTPESFSSSDVSAWDVAVAAPVFPSTTTPTDVGPASGPTFVPPKAKPLPLVQESAPVLASARTSVFPTESNLKPEPGSVPPAVSPAAQPVVPDEYRPASIRNTMVLAPTRRPTEDEIPKISFSPPPETPGEIPASAAGDAFSIETLSIGLPPDRPAEALAVVPVEVIPFVPMKPENTSAPPAPVVSAARPQGPTVKKVDVQKADARDHVLKFIESQKRAAESGDSEKMKNAFIQLSRLYEHPELNDAERPMLMPILDRLALDIIFSCKNHSLEAPYTVRSGDSIRSVAASYHLSEALLMKINGLTGARPLKPGTQLKVVLGQFDAKISASRGELTLILGGLYAGRFPVSIGSQVADIRGEFVVTSKSDSFKGKTLTLGNGVKLCGFDPESTERAPDDAFGFSRRDANELFDILTERSVVSLEE